MNSEENASLGLKAEISMHYPCMLLHCRGVMFKLSC